MLSSLDPTQVMCQLARKVLNPSYSHKKHVGILFLLRMEITEGEQYAERQFGVIFTNRWQIFLANTAVGVQLSSNMFEFISAHDSSWFSPVLGLIHDYTMTQCKKMNSDKAPVDFRLFSSFVQDIYHDVEVETKKDDMSYRLISFKKTY